MLTAEPAPEHVIAVRLADVIEKPNIETFKSAATRPTPWLRS
jgi:hypothetical protein